MYDPNESDEVLEAALAEVNPPLRVRLANALTENAGLIGGLVYAATFWGSLVAPTWVATFWSIVAGGVVVLVLGMVALLWVLKTFLPAPKPRDANSGTRFSARRG